MNNSQKIISIDAQIVVSMPESIDNESAYSIWDIEVVESISELLVSENNFTDISLESNVDKFEVYFALDTADQSQVIDASINSEYVQDYSSSIFDSEIIQREELIGTHQSESLFNFSSSINESKDTTFFGKNKDLFENHSLKDKNFSEGNIDLLGINTSTSNNSLFDNNIIISDENIILPDNIFTGYRNFI